MLFFDKQKVITNTWKIVIKIKNQVGCKYFIKKGNVRNLPVGGLK